jgi:hypothetical protein
MKAIDIRPAMVLKLKREVFQSSAHADGSPLESDLVTVTGIKTRPGYSVPWILSYGDAFKPSDFARFEAWSVRKTDKFTTERG